MDKTHTQVFSKKGLYGLQHLSTWAPVQSICPMVHRPKQRSLWPWQCSIEGLVSATTDVCLMPHEMGGFTTSAPKNTLHINIMKRHILKKSSMLHRDRREKQPSDSDMAYDTLSYINGHSLRLTSKRVWLPIDRNCCSFRPAMFFCR